MKILVVGCGSIGARHIRNLKALKVGEIAACEPDERRLSTMRDQYSLSEVFPNLGDALSRGYEAVLVCTPPSSHIAIAREALEHGAHVFIEKPLSNTLDGVDDLIKRASKEKRVISIGYNFRFHPGLRMIKNCVAKKEIGNALTARAQFGQYLPDWRPDQDYTKSYTARSKLGGGIILDGSHEIDYMRWLFGNVREVFCYTRDTPNLKTDTEGIAEILLRFKSGCLGEIHLDYVRPGYARDLEIVGERGVIKWEYESNAVDKYLQETKEWQSIKLEGENTDMYIAEIENFIASTKGFEEPFMSCIEGKKSLEVVLAAKESATTGRVIRL
jgi:predicted dehydrogenase